MKFWDDRCRRSLESLGIRVVEPGGRVRSLEDVFDDLGQLFEEDGGAERACNEPKRKPSVKFEQVEEELMQDEEFRAEYEKLKPCEEEGGKR